MQLLLKLSKRQRKLKGQLILDNQRH